MRNRLEPQGNTESCGKPQGILHFLQTSLHIEIRQVYLFSPFMFNILLEVLAGQLGRKKMEIIGINTEKYARSFLLSSVVILSMENPNESTPKKSI